MANPEFSIRLAEGGRSITVNQIYAWNRADLPAAISGGSGPKDYIKNDVFAFFEANPECDRVVMVRGCGTPFLLARAGDGWFDMSGKQVIRG